ncbi:ribosomal protein L29 [Chloropicon primus]|uniref:Large ribosomal subunit protein uL29c n=1 Tax=Chloropicon primus TaxID=1764295 RepID=A0A5B8MMD3_9CHLO|nr:ribosomal protein L29 [Chloropicon primus]|eukprot:QDZ21609.1 ribosomal protein L29 [Chloropicon primus]
MRGQVGMALGRNVGCARPVRRAAPFTTGRRTVAARAATTDMGALRKLSDAQLDAQVKESKTEIIKLEMKKASRQEFKPHEIKVHKKKVAQLLTVKREREIEQGVSKRESRRAEKNAALDKYKKQLQQANIVIQRPKSTKLRWQKREAARAAASEK